MVSRAFADALLLAAARIHGAPSLWWGFRRWDGRWYRAIAADGYGALPHALHHQTPWPFFPLFPMALRAGMAFGLPVTLVGLVVNHVAFFLALVAVRRLADSRLAGSRVAGSRSAAQGSPRAADLAVWFVALGPLSFVFSMLYPSAIFFAATAWAFVLVDEHRDVAAGLLGAVATLSRPNGVVVVVALVIAVGWSGARLVRVTGPAVGALGAWMIFNAWRSGDALRFLDAKSAWREVDLLAFVLHPSATPALHLALAAFAIGLVLAARRVLPASWTVLTLLYLLPSLVLGMVGLARYASDVFPPYLAAATVARRRPAILPAVFAALVVAQVVCALVFVTGHSVI